MGDRAYARQAYRRLLRAYSAGMPVTRTATLADAGETVAAIGRVEPGEGVRYTGALS